jgi:hypothetical protein
VAAGFPETLVPIFQTAWSHIPEGCDLNEVELHLMFISLTFYTNYFSVPMIPSH